MLRIFVLEEVAVGCWGLEFIFLAVALILIIELYWFSCFMLLSNIYLLHVLGHIRGDLPTVIGHRIRQNMLNIVNVILHLWHFIIILLVRLVYFLRCHRIRIVMLRYYKFILELVFQILTSIYNLFSKFVPRTVSSLLD